VAPHDKSLTIVGDRGVLFVENLRDDLGTVWYIPHSLFGNKARLRNGLSRLRHRLEPFLPQKLLAKLNLLGTPLTVDVQAIENTSVRGLAAVFKYPQALATLISSIEADLDNQAIICGTEGTLTLSAPFFAPTELRASRALFPGHPITDRIFMGMEAFLGKQSANTRHRLIETNPLSGFIGRRRKPLRQLLAVNNRWWKIRLRLPATLSELSKP
jgi:hypothetical protein